MAPVFELLKIVIRALKLELGGAIPIIGVVMSGQDGQGRIAAGAQMMKLYSGLITKDRR